MEADCKKCPCKKRCVNTNKKHYNCPMKMAMTMREIVRDKNESNKR